MRSFKKRRLDVKKKAESERPWRPATFQELRARETENSKLQNQGRSIEDQTAMAMTEVTAAGHVFYVRVPPLPGAGPVSSHEEMQAREDLAEQYRRLEQTRWAEKPFVLRRWGSVEEWVKRVCDAVGLVAVGYDR